MAEQLHGLIMGEGKIVIAVSSAGCTNAEQFKLDVAGSAGGLGLTVVRTAPDFCKMVPHVNCKQRRLNCRTRL